MIEKFIEWKPRQDSLRKLETIDVILEEYHQRDTRLTVRQLYYQLVSRNVIPNSKPSYDSLGRLLGNARMAGRIDWAAIEDRIRRPERASQFDDIQDLVQAAIYSYRLPRWQDQENYVELWCEKDALFSVLEPITKELHVVLMINRGYSSVSAIYESRIRFLEATSHGKTNFILYLGDFDPSGEDMVRDVNQRLTEMGTSVNINKIALTPEQIEKYALPPNRTKKSDTRAAGFIAKHGNQSYEVDALPPDVLVELVRTEIEGLMDMDKYKVWIEREKKESAKLQKLAGKIG